MTAKDVIVVGGGHNGLAVASVLAREGLKTLVLEARDVPGGLCAGAEFHPGYRHVGIHHDSDTLRPALVDALQLGVRGLRTAEAAPVLLPVPVTVDARSPSVQPGGSHGFLVDADVPPPGHEAGWKSLDAFVARVRPLIARLLDSPAPAVGWDAPAMPLVQHAVAFRRLGGGAMLELLRVAALSAEDWLAEHLSEPVLRAGLALPALLGSFMGPRSPHSASLVLRRRALSGREVVGGPARLAEILADTAKHLGAEIRCGREVARIRVERGQVRGVALRGGDEFDAPRVVSALDPRRTLLDFVPALELPAPAEDEARAIRVRATSAKLHLAVSQLPRFACRAGAFERVRVAPDANTVERAFDDAKHRRLPTRPALDVRVPTVADPSLAPAGHHVLSIHVFGVPSQIEGGWTGAAREQLLDAVLAVLETVAPGVSASVVAAELLVPPELEARYGVSGGHLMHGEHALDQLWIGRPGPLLSGHRTPIRGLWLASGGTHPGGGVSGMPGLLAARVVAEDV